MPKQKKAAPRKEITIRDLYPHLTDEQLVEAERNFNRYLEIVVQIYEETLRRDPTGPSRRSIEQHKEILPMRRKKFESGTRVPTKK